MPAPIARSRVNVFIFCNGQDQEEEADHDHTDDEGQPPTRIPKVCEMEPTPGSKTLRRHGCRPWSRDLRSDRRDHGGRITVRGDGDRVDRHEGDIRVGRPHDLAVEVLGHVCRGEAFSWAPQKSHHGCLLSRGSEVEGVADRVPAPVHGDLPGRFCSRPLDSPVGAPGRPGSKAKTCRSSVPSCRDAEVVSTETGPAAVTQSPAGDPIDDVGLQAGGLQVVARSIG